MGRAIKHLYVAKLRRLALSFPETKEVEAWGHPTFRAGDKIFTSIGTLDGEATIGVKQTKPRQKELVKDPRFIVAPYVGKHGWIV